jgi:hypothetical protein
MVLVLLVFSFVAVVYSLDNIELSVSLNSSTHKFDVSFKADKENADAYGFYYKNYNNNGW